jgi:PD-(D/E)XK nuclease superfamily
MARLCIKTETTTDRIYRRYVAEPSRERGYLGASVIGNECARALWYAFRWAYQPEELEPRKLRLFDTGHREEQRIVEDLRAGGMNVLGEQTGFAALGGHFAGHIDGLVQGLPEAPKTVHLLEIKTHNDKSFKSLLKDGVQISKPAHYAQMQTYMYHLKYSRALYVAVNKNDDNIYTERINVNNKTAEYLLRKAQHIIEADDAPDKLHPDPDLPAAFACHWCQAKSICHDGLMARRNCRTCLSSTAITDNTKHNAGWHCAKHNKLLTLEEQHRGCEYHRYLPSMVPGEQIDADYHRRTITYRMRDGGEWTDGVRPTSAVLDRTE